MATSRCSTRTGRAPSACGRRWTFRATRPGRLLHRALAGIVRAEDRLLRIDRLVERVRTGWRPVADEIDPEIQQRTLHRAHFAIDAMRYPDDEDFYSPRTGLLGIGDHGREPTGQIMCGSTLIGRGWSATTDSWWKP